MIGLTVKDNTIPKNPATINYFGFIVLSVCLISFVCYLVRAANLDIFTRAESCFSECAREMFLENNYVAPHYHGMEFFDKPILTYWLIILFYKLLGISVFAARLPSILSAVFCIALIAYFARRVYGDFIATFSSIILATSLGFIHMASTAMSDMVLCLFDTVAIMALYQGINDRNRRRLSFVIASVAMSLGFLTKSLIALLLPFATFTVLLTLYKDLRVVHLRQMVLGICIFMLIVLPWHIMVWKQCGLNALSWLYVHEQLHRFSANIVGYNFRHPFYYMTFNMVSQLLPWSLALPIIIWGLIKDIKQNYFCSKMQCTIMLLIYVLLHILLFSLSKSNWGYYNLPAYPAASILIAKYLAEWANIKFAFFRKYNLAVVLIIFFSISMISIVYSAIVLPIKIKHEVPHKLAEIITNKYPENQILSHGDLYGQYLLCDWIQFKTEQRIKYCNQDDLIKILGQHKAVWTIMPQNRFNELPSSLKFRLKVLAIEPFSFIPCSTSPLKADAGTENKISLILATNQSISKELALNHYEDFEKSIEAKRSNISHAPLTYPAKSIAVDGIASWWLAKAYFEASKPADIVVLGSSQLGALLGADAYVYDRAVDITNDHRSYTIEHDVHALLNKNWRVFIGALPGLMISDQLVISRVLFSNSYKPKLVVIMFSPRDFIDNCFPSATATEPFAFFAKYDNSISLRNALEAAPVENYESTQVYNYYSNAKSPITLGEPFQRIRPGQIVIRSGDGYFFDNNVDEYRLRYQKPSSQQLTMQLHCLDALLKYLKHQHIATAAVELPLTTANRTLLPETFWKLYKQKVSYICRRNNVDYWDAQSIWDDFSLVEFCDSLDLNLRGGLKLTRPVILAAACKLHLPMYAYNGNFGPLVPGKEAIYFHQSRARRP